MLLLNLLLKENLITRLSKPNVIIGIVLAAVGIAVVMLAFRFAKFIRKTDKIEPGDRIVENMRIIGLLLIIVAMIIIIIN